MANAEFYLALEEKNKCYFLVSDSCLLDFNPNRCKFNHKRKTLVCLIIFTGIYVNNSYKSVACFI